MEKLNDKIRSSVEHHAGQMFDLACDIFDHPELGQQEVYASDLLCRNLEELGFVVERGIGGLPTAFSATYENGKGGPAIGFLAEYDALEGLGHACGHHLQAPICIAAALAVRESLPNVPYKLVIFGTPDEEVGGGKAIMCRAGCFDGVDVAITYHASYRTSVSYKNKANIRAEVVFHGIPAHASGAPQNGRSALDAMALSFHGLECMREHIKEGCRIHYTITETTGPANIIHQRAAASYTLRALDKEYLKDMYDRFTNIIKGAALMTGTTYDIIPLGNMYYELLPNTTFRNAMLDSMEEMGATHFTREIVPGGGSTDTGNVSWIVPTIMYTTFYYGTGTAHTIEWVKTGKTEQAFDSLKWGALCAAHLTCKLINDKELMSKIKEEFNEAKSAAEK